MERQVIYYPVNNQFAIAHVYKGIILLIEFEKFKKRPVGNSELRLTHYTHRHKLELLGEL